MAKIDIIEFDEIYSELLPIREDDGVADPWYDAKYCKEYYR